MAPADQKKKEEERENEREEEEEEVRSHLLRLKTYLMKERVWAEEEEEERK